MRSETEGFEAVLEVSWSPGHPPVSFDVPWMKRGAPRTKVITKGTANEGSGERHILWTHVRPNLMLTMTLDGGRLFRRTY